MSAPAHSVTRAPAVGALLLTMALWAIYTLSLNRRPASISLVTGLHYMSAILGCYRPAPVVSRCATPVAAK